MGKEHGLVIERDEKGFAAASVPSLPVCHPQDRLLAVADHLAAAGFVAVSPDMLTGRGGGQV